MVEIRRCATAELGALMAFIDRHWHKGHVLATSRALMDWQHREPDGSYNYLLAWEGGELLGVLGYLPTRRYDPALVGHNLLWLALWKTRDDVKVAGLGLRILHALGGIEPHVALGVSGINLAHPPMYRALGYQVVELAQHYLVNPDVPRRLISGHAEKTIWPHPREGDAVFTEMDVEELQNLRWESHVIPRKTPTYFARRFLQHPFYRYRVFLASRETHRGLLAMRVAMHQDAAALRIVDFTGDVEVLAQCGAALGKRMHEDKVEYVDFWQFGLPEGALEAAGFERVDPHANVVVPNYYEPFLAKNGRIVCAIKPQGKWPFLVFRADGDQDRPNAP